jgi:TolB-like protein/DNA-binding winged helix-turn-helix (wHTH) protein/Tfp pilus assembly protein PilF
VSSSTAAAVGGGDFRLADRLVQPARNRIEWPGGEAQVEPRVMDVLVCLARRPGAVVSKEELVREVWQGRFVSDDVVWRSIRELRRVLGDDARSSSFIQTVARRGYRLLAPIAPADPGPALPPQPLPPAAAEAPRAGSLQRRIPRLVRVALGLLTAATALAWVASPMGPRWATAWRTPRAAQREGVELRGAGVRVGAPSRVHLAVLPFLNLSGDPGQDYWADGLTEELISRLGSLRPDRLAVVGRTSSMAFKGRAADLREIGRQLGADYLLEGGVRREGEKVRVTSRLVEAEDGTVIWNAEQDLNLWGGLHLQSAVAARVADALAVRLLPAARRRLAQGAAPNPPAHDAYLRGRYLLNKGTPDGIRRAIAAFTQAIAAAPRSPASAPAYASLAECHHLLALFGLAAPGEAYPPAAAAAERAVALDGDLAEGHAILGSILFRYRWQWQAAEAELRRALELNASSAPAHHDYAWLLLALDRGDEALAEMRRAKELEPLSWRATADIGWVEYRARRYAEAVADMRRMLELEPGSIAARECLERALVHLGRDAEALAETRQTLARQDASISPAEIAALTAGDPASAGRRIAAWRLARLRAQARERYVSPYAMALEANAAGDRASAFAYLDAAVASRDPSVVGLGVDPELDGLRPDPRFCPLLTRLGLPPGCPSAAQPLASGR